MNKTREEYAGIMYARVATALREGGDQVSMLADHICGVVNGAHGFPGHMWKHRVLINDGKVVHLDRFEDYLLLPTRNGLGLKSLHQVKNILETAGSSGPRALEIVRAEIPDFDARVAGEKAKLKAPVPAMTREEAGSKGGRGNKASTNSTSFTTPDEKHARRLRRDHPDLWEQVASGAVTLNAAALEAGYRRPSVRITDAGPVAAAARIRAKLGDDFALALGKALLEATKA